MRGCSASERGLCVYSASAGGLLCGCGVSIQELRGCSASARELLRGCSASARGLLRGGSAALDRHVTRVTARRLLARTSIYDLWSSCTAGPQSYLGVKASVGLWC